MAIPTIKPTVNLIQDPSFSSSSSWELPGGTIDPAIGYVPDTIDGVLSSGNIGGNYPKWFSDFGGSIRAETFALLPSDIIIGNELAPYHLIFFKDIFTAPGMYRVEVDVVANRSPLTSEQAIIINRVPDSSSNFATNSPNPLTPTVVPPGGGAIANNEFRNIPLSPQTVGSTPISAYIAEIDIPTVDVFSSYTDLLIYIGRPEIPTQPVPAELDLSDTTTIDNLNVFYVPYPLALIEDTTVQPTSPSRYASNVDLGLVTTSNLTINGFNDGGADGGTTSSWTLISKQGVNGAECINPGTVPTPILTGQNTNTLNISGLVSCAQYTYQFEIVDGNGNSSIAVVEFITGAIGGSWDISVTDDIIIAGNSAGTPVNWQHIVTVNGITNFTIEWEKDGVFSNSTPTYDDNGITPNSGDVAAVINYLVRVRNTNTGETREAETTTTIYPPTATPSGDCDISIDGLDVTDTTLTVTATPNSGVQYSLDGSNWQNSNVFTMVGLGQHIIQVRLTNNITCVCQQIVLIEDLVDEGDSQEVLETFKPDPAAAEFTLSFSLDTNQWVSFHDYSPHYMFPMNKRLFAITGGKIWEHNEGEYGVYYGVAHPSIIDLIFNADVKALLSYVNWESTVLDEFGIPVFDETISHITVRNRYQTTGKLDIKHLDSARNVENDWKFNDIRDIGIRNKLGHQNIIHNFNVNENSGIKADKWDTNKSRFVSAYCIVRLEVDNKNNYQIMIHDVDPAFKESIR